MTNEPTASPQTAASAASPDESESGASAKNSEESIRIMPTTLAEALDRLDVEIARRAQAEEVTREIEERFRQLSAQAGKFLWMSDPQTNELLFVSPGYEEVWARTRESSYNSPDDWAASFGRKAGARDSTARRDQIYQVAGPDGSVRWVRDRMFPIRDQSGNVMRILGIAEDVTESKSMHEHLKQMESQLRALLAAVPDLVFRVRRDGTILEVKVAADSGWSLAEDAVVSRNLRHLLPASLAAQAMQQISAALKSKEVQTCTCQFLLPDELRDFEARSSACGEDEVIAVIRDVTDRKRLEREILEVSSREQQRIGQDLHDSLGQHLTGITFLTKALERKLAAQDQETAVEAAEIGKLVLQALAQTRNLARGLFPAQLEQNGLGAALEDLANTVSRMCNVKCTFKSDPSIAVQDNVLATHVFRIAQEAINNSVKHGKANTIDVTLVAAGDRMELIVNDDGAGFSPEAKLDGLGLRIMHYRARRIGGAFEVSTSETGGTRVICSFRNKYESN